MKDMLLLSALLFVTIARHVGPGGAKAIVADSLLMKQQLLIINLSRHRSPKLTAMDRFLLGLLLSFPSTSPHSKSGSGYKAVDLVEISPVTQATQISPALFVA